MIALRKSSPAPPSYLTQLKRIENQPQLRMLVAFDIGGFRCTTRHVGSLKA
jgi:hypothetical protein